MAPHDRWNTVGIATGVSRAPARARLVPTIAPERRNRRRTRDSQGVER